MFFAAFFILRASLLTQMIKNPPVKQETWVQSLGQEDPLEKGIETHYSIPAWKIPWTVEPGRLQSMGSQDLWTQWGEERVGWMQSLLTANSMLGA